MPVRSPLASSPIDRASHAGYALARSLRDLAAARNDQLPAADPALLNVVLAGLGELATAGLYRSDSTAWQPLRAHPISVRDEGEGEGTAPHSCRH